MHVVEWTFWSCLALIVYAYAGYPLLLGAFGQLIRREGSGRAGATEAPFDWPAVSLLIPAYNEAPHLRAKLDNLDAIDYPRDRLEILFVSDGSTDATAEILAAAERPGLRLLLLPTRQGKPSAMNLAVSRSRHDILIFCDAATLVAHDAVKKLVRHFADPGVGVVCGAVELGHTAESAATEGVYWKYEMALRRGEARIGATLTALGPFYAIRRAACRPLPSDAILEDFLRSMTARRLGYQVVDEPRARAIDLAAPTVAGEFTRRVRLAAGSFAALAPLTRAATGTPAVFWSFISHKLLRWLAPFFLLGLLATSLLLWQQPLYRLAIFVQAVVYLWALAGMAFRKRLQNWRFALLGYFLVAMNLAFLVGFARSLTGRQPVTWTRVN